MSGHGLRDDESERDLEPSEQKGPEGERLERQDDRPADEGARSDERGAAEGTRAEDEESNAEDERDFTQRNVGGKSTLEP